MSNSIVAIGVRSSAVAFTAAGLILAAVASFSKAAPNPKPPKLEDIRAAVQKGALAFRLTTPDELQALLGKPDRERKGRDGDMETLLLEFPAAQAEFARVTEPPGPFTLYWLEIQGEEVDIGRGRPIILRTEEDLKKLDSFWGLAGISLAKLDLRQHEDLLKSMTFNSLTVWPEPSRLPAGFDPVKLMEQGKDPGLGVRQLHAAGITGEGVGIAIIDQPLLREHTEIKDRIVRYDAIDVGGVPEQMHGPAVASIAVGKTCGVAPKAALYYYAVPTWKWTANQPWADTLDRIVAVNQSLTNTPKIRVVSISLGAFSERSQFARWKDAVKRAEEAGILVLTCDPSFLRLATLRRLENRSGLAAADYERGRYGAPSAAVCVPAGNRTIASEKGPQVYTYDRVGGLSWTVPYLAGLAALGCQIDPGLKPQEVLALWRQTATKASAGSVVNPPAFVQAVKGRRR